jgi:hypothetical protein
MKKSILLLLVTVGIFSLNVNSNADVVDKIALYLPNRIVDMFDIFSVNLGVGPVVRAELRATRAFDFGGGIGISAMAVKDYNRQYGGCFQDGWNGAFTCISCEDTEREHTSRMVKKFWYHSSGIPLPSEKIYNFYTGARDYWEIGADLALLVDFHFALHPVEVADFVTGWFFIDLKGDDFTSDDL